jgi:hypothetical protein
LHLFAAVAFLFSAIAARAQTDPLPSWNDGAAKQAIAAFVKATTDESSPYGPGGGLPDTRVGTFSEALMTEAQKDGWVVISMKSDWKKIFPFDN